MPIPPIPADGSLIVGATAPEVYLIEAQRRRWIPAPFTFEAMGFRGEDVQMFSDAEVNLVPLFIVGCAMHIDGYNGRCVSADPSGPASRHTEEDTMGDKGGKKDKEKNKKQAKSKQAQKAKKKQEAQPKTTPS